jgi:DNA-binding response OmpR family regulator
VLERPTILVIEPDAGAAHDLRALLGVRYAVHTAGSAAAARAWLAEAPRRLDVVVFELTLPDADGLILCAELRAATDAALLVHTSLSGQRELVLSLRLGADDFVAKPADQEELEARIGALIRRATRSRRAAARAQEARESGATCQTIGDLSVDRERAVVSVGGRVLHLTQAEFRLLSGFARHLGAPLGRDQLARLATGHEYIAGTRSLDMHVRRLRWKLRAAAEAVGTGGLESAVRIPAIAAVRGYGYRMIAPAGSDDDSRRADHFRAEVTRSGGLRAASSAA